MSRTKHEPLWRSGAGMFTLILSLTLMGAGFPTKPYEAYVDSYSGTPSRAHIWNDGAGHQRSESDVNGTKITSIMDFNNKVIYAINDQRRTINTMPMTYDSSQPDPQINWQPIGAKVIEGHPCQGKRATVSGQQVEYWEGNDTGCTVAIVTNGKTTLKLVSWKPLVPNPTMFSLPAGYQKIDMGAMMRGFQSGVPSK